MRLALLVAFLVTVLLSIWVSFHFHITFIALVTGFLVSLKQIKVIWIFEWLLRFLFVRLPQRVLTALVKLYVIDRKTMHWLTTTAKRYHDYLRQHHKTKLIVASILALILMGVSAWWIGLWLLVIYEVETLFLMIWKRVWPMISETAFVETVARCGRLFGNTRLGRLLKRADAWLEEYLRRNAENVGQRHKQYLIDTIEETLGYMVKLHPPLPPSTIDRRFDLTDQHAKMVRKRPDRQPAHRRSISTQRRPKR